MVFSLLPNPWAEDHSVASYKLFKNNLINSKTPKNMATKTLSRRQWIKNSSLVTGSLALLSGSLTDVLATPSKLTPYISTTETMSGEMIRRQAMADIKARLSANENPFGPSEKAKKALMEAID